MYKQLDLNFEEPVQETSYPSLLDPEPLREGVEFANVQRVFEESHAFRFSAPNKIKQPRDVAYIFKQLETAAVENAFAVLVKDGKPTVIHLGMGKIDATFAPMDSVVAADKKLKADKIYFIHNHPSGSIKASAQDMQMFEKWKSFFGDRMQPGIIINTRSGLYGEFDEKSMVRLSELVAGEEQQYAVKLYSFSKLVFDKAYRETYSITSPRDAARFVSSQRLGERPKLSYLIVSNSCDIQANIHTQRSAVPSKDIKDLSRQIARDVAMFGGKNVISYGSGKISKMAIAQLAEELKKNEISLLDHIQIVPNVKNALGLGEGSETYQYMSASDEGWLRYAREPELKYGLTIDGIRVDINPIRPQETGTLEEYMERSRMYDEEREIIARAQADGTYLKAPNGKPTKLTPEQWVQVRTQAFKDWFGDWELANFYSRANEAWNNKKSTGKVVIGLSERAKKRFNELLGTDIKQLIITDDSIRHIRNNHSESEELRGQKNMTPEDIVVIPYLVNNFDTMELSPKYDDNKGNRALEIHKRINGVSVIATIEKGKNKEFLVTNYQFIKSDALDASIETPGPNVRNDSDIAKVQQEIERIKEQAKNASKGVDVNGEPLVVYHGTAEEFNTFQSKNGTYWFAKESDYAEAMAEERGGARVIDAYLNMKNPYHAVLEPGKFNDPNFEASIIQSARRGGYDSVILQANTDNELLANTSYIVFQPSQIKSAKENVGTFDIENPDIRFRVGAGYNISAFANKYGFDVAEVTRYADAMRIENSSAAHLALSNMKLKVRIDNTGKSLGEFVKIFAPIKAELYEKFGNLDTLIDTQRQKALEERNVMEAARKRAEAEARAGRKRLEEFEGMSEKQLDDAYFKAIKDNDEGRMRDLVNEAARRNGYVSLDEFRMAHSAPVYDETGEDKSMVDVANNRDQIRESLNAQFRMNRTQSRDESIAAIQGALAAIDRGENPTVTIYRAVPKSLREGRVRNGDWVTLSESYADNHGKHVLGIGDYRIMKEVVPAENLYWDGNDINEWGYDDRSDYRYRNTKNNRKLNDLITRDDAGEIIPLSQRFNARKNDVRFRFIGEKGAARLDQAEETTARLDNLAVAWEMEAAKKDAGAIKMATGWERGADGKWRYEEPDFEVDVKGLARKNYLYDNLPWGKEYNALTDKIFEGVELSPKESVRFEELSERAEELRKVYETSDSRYLDDYVKDKKLFEAYPELKQVRVEMYDDPKDNGVLYAGATWYASRNLIRVNEQALSDEGFRSVMVHEVQHAIQEMEGFAQGGNRNTYREHLESLREKHDAWSMLEEFDRKRGELGEDALQIDVYNAVREEYHSLGFEFGDGVFPSREAYDKGFNLWVRGYDKEGYEEAYKEYQHLTDKFGHGLGNDRYRQIAGEVEARNVQSRLTMTPAERRASLASETEDVARSEQILFKQEARVEEKAALIKDLSEKLHTPIRIVNAKDVHHSSPDMEKRMRSAKGWYSIKNDQVAVILDNHHTADDLTKTVLHEVVGHKGLREVVGEKAFQVMCESVYRSMPANLRQSYLSRYGTPAVAGEEYLAYVAEHGTTVSMWQSITSALKVALNSIGIHVNYSYKEVAALLKRSRRHLENKRAPMQPSVRKAAGVKKQTVKPRKRGRGL